MDRLNSGIFTIFELSELKLNLKADVITIHDMEGQRLLYSISLDTRYKINLLNEKSWRLGREMLMSMSLLINVQSKSSGNLIFMSDTILIFDFNEIKSLAREY